MTTSPQCTWEKLKPEQRLYGISVPIIGLTGGIGTGKSTVSKKISDLGYPVICADQLVKNIYKTEKTLSFLNQNYHQVISESGAVDFPRLREIFFSNSKAKKEIEELIYSQLPESFQKAYTEFHSCSLIIYDVPLLFEKKMEDFFDLIVCVYAPEELQIERVMTRDQVDSLQAQKVLDHQVNIEIKKKKADVVIFNNKTLSELEIEVTNFVTSYLN